MDQSTCPAKIKTVVLEALVLLKTKRANPRTRWWGVEGITTSVIILSTDAMPHRRLCTQSNMHTSVNRAAGQVYLLRYASLTSMGGRCFTATAEQVRCREKRDGRQGRNEHFILHPCHGVPGEGDLPSREEWIGGVQYTAISNAPPVEEVVESVQQIIEGAPVVGHGLQNDLIALGVEHPESLLRDTAKYSRFQRKDGSVFTLKKLVKLWLGRSIQLHSKPHSAREDARAVMELYRRCILVDPSQALSEAELVDAYLSELSVDTEVSDDSKGSRKF